MKAIRELQVLNKLGLHARPASELVRCALRYKQTQIVLRKDDQTFNPTSILEMLTAELDQGSVFTVEADGPEAEQVLQSFAELLEKFRDQEEAQGS